MSKPAFERLTERQRTCLRLVFLHYKSKPIARKLGVKPGTVDAHLKAAPKTLGVSDRGEAARMLAEHEGNGPCQRLAYRSPAMADQLDSSASHSPINEELKTANAGVLREDQAGFDARLPPPAYSLKLPWGRERHNDLNIPKRLAWILAIALSMAILFLVVMAAIDMLARRF